MTKKGQGSAARPPKRTHFHVSKKKKKKATTRSPPGNSHKKGSKPTPQIEKGKESSDSPTQTPTDERTSGEPVQPATEEPKEPTPTNDPPTPPEAMVEPEPSSDDTSSANPTPEEHSHVNLICERVPQLPEMIAWTKNPQSTRIPISFHPPTGRAFRRYNAKQFDNGIQNIPFAEVPDDVKMGARLMGAKWKFTIFQGMAYWQADQKLGSIATSGGGSIKGPTIGEKRTTNGPWPDQKRLHSTEPNSDKDENQPKGSQLDNQPSPPPALDLFEREYQPSTTGARTPLTQPVTENTNDAELSRQAGQDAEELRGNLVHHLRMPRLDSEGTKHELVAKNRGTPAKDANGTQVKAPLAGSYRSTIWRTNSNHHKVLAQPCRILEVVPRACQLSLPQDDFKKTFKGMQERLPVEVLGPQEMIPSVYVGISSLTAQPVYITKPKRVGNMDYRDNLAKVDARMEPSRKIAGSLTILHETCIVAGNLGQLKRLVVDNDRVFEDEPALMERAAYQNKRALEFLSVEPLAAKSPGDEPTQRPNLRDFYRANNGLDTHYEHEVPPLGVLTPPQEMISRLTQFLARYPKDPMPLNLSMQAVMVYLDIQDAFERKVEAGVREPEGVRHPIPEVSPEAFVLYYPHWLRFHEVHKMTRYMHPMRFIDRAYRTDVGIDLERFNIEKGTLQIGRMRELVNAVASKTENISPRIRIPVIPASMPGSVMIWPSHVRRGEAPCDGLFALCLLDDVRTIGLPSYHLRTKGRLDEMIAIPDDLARERNHEHPTAHHYAPFRPPSYFWDPSQKAALVSVAGPAESVGPVFKPLDSAGRETATGPVPAVFYPFSYPGSSQQHIHIDWKFFFSPEARALITSTNEKRLELAKELGKTIDDLIFDPIELTWKWDGSHNDLVQAAIDRQLPIPAPAPMFHASSDTDGMSETQSHVEDLEVTLPVMNPDILPGTIIDKIADTISSNDVRALDWDRVTEATRNPALKRHVIQALQGIWVFLLRELEQARELLKDPTAVDEPERMAVMRTLPIHVLRVAGVLGADQVGSVDILKDWEKFAEPCSTSTDLQVAHGQIQILKAQLDNPVSWMYASLTATTFYNSPACLSQVAMLGELEKLLEVNVREEASGSPIPEIDLYSADA